VSTAPSGRLDRLGPIGTRLRALTGPVRAAGASASRRVRVAMRDPVAVRDATRDRLLSHAEEMAGHAANPDEVATAADAALMAWLADPSPVTGALLTQTQGRRAATPGVPVRPEVADLPADEAQRLAARLDALSALGARPDAPDALGARSRGSR